MHCSEFRVLKSRVRSKYLVIPSRRRANWGEPPFQVERLAKMMCRAVPGGIWSMESRGWSRESLYFDLRLPGGVPRKLN